MINHFLDKYSYTFYAITALITGISTDKIMDNLFMWCIPKYDYKFYRLQFLGEKFGHWSLVQPNQDLIKNPLSFKSVDERLCLSNYIKNCIFQKHFWWCSVSICLWTWFATKNFKDEGKLCFLIIYVKDRIKHSCRKLEYK